MTLESIFEKLNKNEELNDVEMQFLFADIASSLRVLAKRGY